MSTSPVSRVAPDRPSSETTLSRAIKLGVAISVLLLMIGLDLPLCPFATVARVPCPGCGLTRATLAVLHGHLGQAYSFHPLVFIASPVILAAVAFHGYVYVWRGELAGLERFQGGRATLVAVVLGALMIGVWVARFFGAFGGPVPV